MPPKLSSCRSGRRGSAGPAATSSAAVFLVPDTHATGPLLLHFHLSGRRAVHLGRTNLRHAYFFIQTLLLTGNRRLLHGGRSRRILYCQKRVVPWWCRRRSGDEIFRRGRSRFGLERHGLVVHRKGLLRTPRCRISICRKRVVLPLDEGILLWWTLWHHHLLLPGSALLGNGGAGGNRLRGLIQILRGGRGGFNLLSLKPLRSQ